MSVRLRPATDRHLQSWYMDVALATSMAVALVAIRVIEAHGLVGSSWAGYLPSVLAALALVGRRHRPLEVFVCTLALALLAIAFVPPSGAISLPVVVAVYTLAQVEPRPRAVLLALLAGSALALARGLLQYRGWSDARTAVEPALALAALFLGWALASHRAYIAEIEARALQAERTREDEAQRQVDAERLRIARELHDVLAHGIATISVQAGVAAHVLQAQPEHAAEALRTIKATSNDALRELRDILGVLRQADEVEPREPTPRLSQIDRLIDATSDAGVPTQVQISGERRPLPATVELAAYRIVQESLTNVLRHAAGASALVAIRYGREEMTLSIDDDGCERQRAMLAASSPVRAANSDQRAPGHGIRGMRERVHALGGELDAGPRAGGGFRVSARLPLSATR